MNSAKVRAAKVKKSNTFAIKETDLQRYCDLRSQIAPLEKEKNDLGKKIKKALQENAKDVQPSTKIAARLIKVEKSGFDAEKELALALGAGMVGELCKKHRCFKLANGFQTYFASVAGEEKAIQYATSTGGYKEGLILFLGEREVEKKKANCPTKIEWKLDVSEIKTETMQVSELDMISVQ